jgi:uncharacterized protein DUF4386
MTRTTNARIAGFTFLFYIAVGILSMVLFNPASGAEGVPAKLAAIAEHATAVRIGICLNLLCCFSALVLAVTLYSITRDVDSDLAMLGLTCRVGEGVIGAVFMFADLGLLWLGTVAGANAPDPTAVNALGAFFFKVGDWSPTVGAIFFASGSTLFSYLLLRGRMVPVALAWLGVLASVLLVVLLPGQLAGFIKGPVLDWMWLPALVFEVMLALWLLTKGVAMPQIGLTSRTA